MEHPELTIYDHDTVYVEGGTGDNYVLAHIESSSHKSEMKWAQLFKAAPLMYEALQVLLNNLPESEIEIARECLGNTNTVIISQARRQAQAALDAAGGE